MNREIIEKFLASFPYVDTIWDPYRRGLRRLYVCGDPLESWSAAGLSRFSSRPEWGSSRRYSAQHISEWRAP